MKIPKGKISCVRANNTVKVSISANYIKLVVKVKKTKIVKSSVSVISSWIHKT